MTAIRRTNALAEEGGRGPGVFHYLIKAANPQLAALLTPVRVDYMPQL